MPEVRVHWSTAPGSDNMEDLGLRESAILLRDESRLAGLLSTGSVQIGGLNSLVFEANSTGKLQWKGVASR